MPVKKILLALLLVLLIAGGVWAYYRFLYVENPRDAYLRTVAAAMLGDEDQFLAGFTEESRPLVAGLLALSRGDDARSSQRHPYYYLVTENIEGVDTEEDHAWIKVKRAGDSGSRSRYDIPLLRKDHSWFIDALQFTGKERVVKLAR